MSRVANARQMLAGWGFRVPEKYAVLVYAISMLFTILTLVQCLYIDSPDLSDILMPLLIASMVLLTVEVWIVDMGRFVALLSVHVVALAPVIMRVGYRYPLAGVLATCSLVLTVSLQFPIRISTPVNAAIVMGPAIVALMRGTSVIEIAAPVAAGIGVACLGEIVIYYREALVKCSERIAEEYRSLENLSAANESFIRRLPEMKQESAEEERLRITRELHDSLGYSMTSIAMIMNATQYLLDENPQKVKEYCLKTKEMALDTMSETRRTLYKLRAIGRETPSQPAIFFMRMCRDFQEATGIETTCHSGNLTRVLPERVFQTLFRTVQVGFINALRHGKAARIELFFAVQEEGLSMTIWNNVENVEFDMDQIVEGIGLKGVRERIEILDGEMVMDRTHDIFTLAVFIPAKELSDRADV